MPVTTFLNGRPYARLRGAAFLFLSDACQVLSGTVTGDSGGGGTTSWNAGGTIPCRVDPMGGGESIVGGRISPRTTHLISLPAGTQIDERNRVAVDGRGTFEVTALRQHTAEQIALVETVEL